MSVTLHIIVEGRTEELFVNLVIRPHLASLSIGVSARLVSTKELPDYTYGGGPGNFAQVKKEITRWLKHDRRGVARFTTMFDLYELPRDFPGYWAAASRDDPYQRVKDLEDALAEEINDSRFIPYIQLHEFEALLLSDPQKFESQFDDSADGIASLVAIVSQFPSPEHVNDDDPPSKRIGKELLNYNHFKTAAGPIVAEKIGLPTLRSKCKHFASWLAKLEQLATEN